MIITTITGTTIITTMGTGLGLAITTPMPITCIRISCPKTRPPTCRF